MNRLSRTTTCAALAALCLLSLCAPAFGQGRYRGRRYTKADVGRIIRRVEERSDAFRRVVDRSLDNGRLDGTEREDRINEQVKELENAIDGLRTDFDRRQTWAESREQVQRVLAEADEVNAIMNRRWARVHNNVRRQWTLVRNDLNRLAGVYNLPLLRA